ncbi:MAG: glycoside hydrolase family 99-like domain-containing protein [Candidatus Symbiothrix sp.]|jgi:hypothetical protein|nr:glycoside hydrolase family 99-like domain-containing protein [Candidatus Symbiothrix sp.]
MKKIVYIASTFILLLVAFIACEDKPEVYEFPKDKFFYEIPEVPVTEDYVVGVPYEVKTRDAKQGVWLVDKKAQSYTGTPIHGEYDLRVEEDFLKQQMEWGKQAGIDFFIISWGGHGLNDTILSNYEKWYQPGHPQVVIRFDPGYRFPKSVKDTLMLNQVQMDSLRIDFDSVYTSVMTKNYAYKNRNTGNPVMVLTNFTNSANIPSTSKFTEFLRTAVNNKVWIMAELGGRLTSPERWGFHAANGYSNAFVDGYVQPDSIKAFDAFFITDVSTDNKDRYDALYSLTDYNFRYWQSKMQSAGKEYVPTIMPAFDNLINDAKSNTYLIPRWNAETNSAYVVSAEKTKTEYNFSNIQKNPYQEFANVAKRNVGPSRILIVYNWNDYANGINLEPTVEFGDDYLKYTKQFFKK